MEICGSVKKPIYAQIAQLVRVSPCHGEDREFESLLGRKSFIKCDEWHTQN